MFLVWLCRYVPISGIQVDKYHSECCVAKPGLCKRSENTGQFCYLCCQADDSTLRMRSSVEMRVDGLFPITCVLPRNSRGRILHIGCVHTIADRSLLPRQLILRGESQQGY